MRDLERLRLFLALAEERNFARASRRAHVSPSTLTRTVQGLERELGALLVERHRVGVSLTPAGQQVRAYATHAVEAWEDLHRSLSSVTSELHGRLRLFCTVTAAQQIVPDLLARFRAAHPGVRVDVDTGNAAEAFDRLREGLEDVAVAALPGRLPPRLVAEELGTTPLVFVADRRWRQEGRPWSEVPLVLPAAGVVRERVEAWFRALGARLDVAAEPQGHEAVLTLVSLGVGVGVVPRLVLENSALRDRVAVVEVRPSLGPLRLGLCALERSLADPVVAAFWATSRAAEAHEAAQI